MGAASAVLAGYGWLVGQGAGDNSGLAGLTGRGLIYGLVSGMGTVAANLRIPGSIVGSVAGNSIVIALGAARGQLVGTVNGWTIGRLHTVFAPPGIVRLLRISRDVRLALMTNIAPPRTAILSLHVNTTITRSLPAVMNGMDVLALPVNANQSVDLSLESSRRG